MHTRYVSLHAARKSDYTACHPRKTTTFVYILHVVPITTHTHDRRKSIGKKETRKEKSVKERKERPKTRKSKRKNRKDKARGSEEKKEGKKCHTAVLADPRDGIGLVKGIKCIINMALQYVASSIPTV